MNILLEKARRMLEENIIPFWQGLRDDEYGGYIGHVDFSMHSDCKAEKGCILHSRILWFFSEAALLLKGLLRSGLLYSVLRCPVQIHDLAHTDRISSR